MNKKFYKKEKGITLIALVITIIVLLLLAGAVISMLSGKNGILKQAATAKTETELKSQSEQVKLAAMAALTAGKGKVDLEVLNSELSKIDGYVAKEIKQLPDAVKIGDNKYIINTDGTISVPITIPSLIESGEPVEALTTIEEDDGDVITIPEKFKLASDSGKTVEEGIVVIAPDGSEFVWILVDDVTYSSANENISKIPTSTTNGSLNGYNYTPMGIQVDSIYKGILYAFDSVGGAYLRYPSENNYYQGTTSEFREPDYLSSQKHGDAVTGSDTKGVELLKRIVGLKEENGNIITQWKNQLQKEYKEMLESVEKYRGFYVGRYETSLNEDKTKAQVKPGKYPATAAEDSANTWYGLYQKQREYSKNEYESGKTLDSIVGSSMIWGSQYDQMMIWMQKNNIDVTEDIGSNRNLGATDDNGENITGTTGTTSTDKINNIYDLYGNGLEWTLEASKTTARSVRGGYYKTNYAPSACNFSYPHYTNSYCCSRMTLYVKIRCEETVNL